MPKPEPRWVSRLVVDAVQADMLLTHGGLPGIRDEDALESALARPRQRFAYEPNADLPALAAAYGYALVRNHPYSDGNKRVGLMVLAVFLALNGLAFTASQAGVVTTIVALASGEIDEDVLADWIRAQTAKRPRRSSQDVTPGYDLGYRSSVHR